MERTIADIALNYKLQAENYVIALRLPTDDHTLKSIIKSIFFFIHPKEKDFQAKCIACADAGAPSEFFRIAKSNEASWPAKSSSLRTLGQMCCFNERVSTKLAQDPEFGELVVSVFHPVYPIAQLWVDTCYVMNVVAAESWE